MQVPCACFLVYFYWLNFVNFWKQFLWFLIWVFGWWASTFLHIFFTWSFYCVSWLSWSYWAFLCQQICSFLICYFICGRNLLTWIVFWRWTFCSSLSFNIIYTSSNIIRRSCSISWWFTFYLHLSLNLNMLLAFKSIFIKLLHFLFLIDGNSLNLLHLSEQLFKLLIFFSYLHI